MTSNRRHIASLTDDDYASVLDALAFRIDGCTTNITTCERASVDPEYWQTCLKQALSARDALYAARMVRVENKKEQS